MPPRRGTSSSSKQTEDAKRPTKTSTKSKQSVKTPFLVPLIPPPRPLAPKVEPKGKERATEDGIWADIYHPTNEQELAVHKKKVEAVKGWLTDAFESMNLKKYRKLLVLAGPAGAGKTATIRVLSREMKFDTIEWQNAMDDVFDDNDYESLSHKFQSFMSRAADMKPLTGTNSTSISKSTQRQIILLEDLPNLLHGPTLEAFQRALAGHIKVSDTPIVLIISDTGSRGQYKDEEGWSNRRATVMDVRTILPTSLLQSPYVTRIDFNPVANTFMKKSLQAIVDRRFGPTSKIKPSKVLVDSIVESSSGDLRSALMALQFATIASHTGHGTKKSGTTPLQVITKREHSLALFHLLGKIMYNKRVGDPLSESLSKADREKEKNLERAILPPPPLPLHLSVFERRSSRVDVNALYSESPIDTSLLSLYIHQNYDQFCEEVEQCDGIVDALSQFDAMGDTWDSRGQVAMEKFHALTMGTLISLPSPVPRQGQKLFKPDYFEYLKKDHNANDAILDVQEWLWTRQDIWSAENIQLWLPSVLRHQNRLEGLQKLPATHSLFSSLPWIRNAALMATTLDENDENTGQFTSLEAQTHVFKALDDPQDAINADEKYWLEEDDISEF